MDSVDVSFFGIDSRTLDALGGRKGLAKIANDFYFYGVYKSPILGPLFHIKDSAHPEHLCMFLTHLMSVDNEYMRQRNSYFAVKLLHENARRDPIRNKCPPGGGAQGGWWTCSQRDEWKRLFLEACERNGVQEKVLLELAAFVDRVMAFYGPFSADRAE
jgi:truncated hemoglobin YjbI